VGQRIEIEGKTVVENAVVFATNRSFTGTDGEGFANAEEAGASATFPAQLATELFEADGDLTRVYVDQNALVVERSTGWPEDAVDSLSKVIEDFFLFYA
jgi:cytochrome c